MNIKSFTLVLSMLSLIACNTSKKGEKAIENIRTEQAYRMMRACGFLELPLVFDAGNDLPIPGRYRVDQESADSLLTDPDIYKIIGFLPDTSDFYAFLFYSAGDMLYPSIFTMDKDGNRIDRQTICTGGCAGHASLEVSHCYDSVWIQPGLKIRSLSVVRGTVEPDDEEGGVLEICNRRELTGYIDRTGKIVLKEHDIVDCAETN